MNNIGKPRKNTGKHRKTDGIDSGQLVSHGVVVIKNSLEPLGSKATTSNGKGSTVKILGWTNTGDTKIYTDRNTGNRWGDKLQKY